MPWFKLTGDERINRRCATDHCGGQPTERLESGGVGSDYCSGCRAKIEAGDDARIYGIGFSRHYPDGSGERIPPEQVHIHGNTINTKN